MVLAGLKSLLKRDKGKDKADRADWSRPEDWQDFVFARRTRHPIQRRVLTDKALARRFSSLEWCERDALIMTLEQELGLTHGLPDMIARGTPHVLGEDADHLTFNAVPASIWDHRHAVLPCHRIAQDWRASPYNAQDDGEPVPETMLECLHKLDMEDREAQIQNSWKMSYIERKFGSLGAHMLRKFVAEVDRILGTSEPLEEDEREVQLGGHPTCGVSRQENTAAGNNSQYGPSIGDASRTSDPVRHGCQPLGAGDARGINANIISDGVSVTYWDDGYWDWSDGHIDFMTNDERQSDEDTGKHRHGWRTNVGANPVRGRCNDLAHTYDPSLSQKPQSAEPVRHRQQTNETGREVGTHAAVSNHEEVKRQREFAERKLDEAGCRHDEAKRRLEQEKRMLEEERARFQRMLWESAQHDNGNMEIDPEGIAAALRFSAGGHEPSQLPSRSTAPPSIGNRDALRCNPVISDAVAHSNDGVSGDGGMEQHEAAQYRDASSPVSDDGFDIHDAPPAYSELPTEVPPMRPSNLPLWPPHVASQPRAGLGGRAAWYAQRRFGSDGPLTSGLHPNSLAEQADSTPQLHELLGSIPTITVRQYEFLEPEAPTTSRRGGRAR